jgi:integrase/recombinase XerD
VAGDPVTPLASQLDGYLRMRRALGFGLERQGQLLAGFVAFAGDAPRITTAMAVEWATQPEGADRTWHAGRLSAVRAGRDPGPLRSPR